MANDRNNMPADFLSNTVEVGDAWQGPCWRPQLRSKKDPDGAARDADPKHPDSFALGGLFGKLGRAEAWGRPHYTVTAADGNEYLVPEHAVLWNRLNKVADGADVFVDMTEDRHETDNGTAFGYTVRSREEDVVKEKRDALKVESKKDRKKQGNR